MYICICIQYQGNPSSGEISPENKKEQITIKQH